MFDVVSLFTHPAAVRTVLESTHFGSPGGGRFWDVAVRVYRTVAARQRGTGKPAIPASTGTVIGSRAVRIRGTRTIRRSTATFLG